MDTAPTSAEGRMRMANLEAEDRYHSERYALYRAKTYGPRPTSAARLRTLRLASEAATSRLRRARDLADQTSPAR